MPYSTTTHTINKYLRVGSGIPFELCSEQIAAFYWLQGGSFMPSLGIVLSPNNLCYCSRRSPSSLPSTFSVISHKELGLHLLLDFHYSGWRHLAFIRRETHGSQVSRELSPNVFSLGHDCWGTQQLGEWTKLFLR